MALKKVAQLGLRDTGGCRRLQFDVQERGCQPTEDIEVTADWQILELNCPLSIPREFTLAEFGDIPFQRRPDIVNGANRACPAIVEDYRSRYHSA